MKRRNIITSLCFAIALLFGSCQVNNAVQFCIEEQKDNCACTKEYDPVCGCNDKTYGNACEAECFGITDYSKGKCN